ncbi:unnamed protein product [Paramecium sonneborni]|uniref:Uncharacterized protein n=1 Tax=Paramecium sonneborni TaxID=65129 RepID=A0A8S1NC19_9CILI|nr:unnamed protein product [Paramecium sonneborni]
MKLNLKGLKEVPCRSDIPLSCRENGFQEIWRAEDQVNPFQNESNKKNDPKPEYKKTLLIMGSVNILDQFFLLFCYLFKLIFSKHSPKFGKRIFIYLFQTFNSQYNGNSKLLFLGKVK